MSQSDAVNAVRGFNKVLSDTAVKIKRLEHQRDTPKASGGPGQRNAPGGAKSPSFAVSPVDQGTKNRINDQIGNLKASALKLTNQLVEKMPPNIRDGMKARAMDSLYPKGGDLNQIPGQQKPEAGKKHPGDKMLDNAQERFNYQKADQARSQMQKQDQSRFTQGLNSKQQQQKDQHSKQMQSEKSKSADKSGNSSMSTRFTQPLNGNSVQKKSIEPKSVGSMSTRFSQSLSHNTPGGSANGKLSPTKSATSKGVEPGKP